MNSYTTLTPFAYLAVDDAIKLEFVYSVLQTKTNCYKVTGQQSLFNDFDIPVYYCDKNLPVGVAKCP